MGTVVLASGEGDGLFSGVKVYYDVFITHVVYYALAIVLQYRRYYVDITGTRYMYV